jgi:hypothetical protein
VIVYKLRLGALSIETLYESLLLSSFTHMPNLNRKDFIQSLAIGGGSLLAFTPGVLAQAAGASPASLPGAKAVTLKNESFELSIQPGKDLVCHLVHSPSGTVLADGPYSYPFGTPAFTIAAQDQSSVTLKGMTDAGLEVSHVFRAPPQSPWIEEELTIRNPTSGLARGTYRCGFVLPVKPDTLAKYVFTAVPFRREPRDGSHSYSDYTLDQILNLTRRSRIQIRFASMRIIFPKAGRRPTARSDSCSRNTTRRPGNLRSSTRFRLIMARDCAGAARVHS